MSWKNKRVESWNIDDFNAFLSDLRAIFDTMDSLVRSYQKAQKVPDVTEVKLPPGTGRLWVSSERFR